MSSIPRSHKVFFAVICAAALLVSVLGIFAPTYLASLFSWVKLPPLHARFVGAIYGYGTVYMLGCLLTNRPATARWGLLLITIWTGLLGITSFLNFATFDLTQLSVQIWFVSYTIYPLIGLALLLMSRSQPVGTPERDRALPAWAQRFLWVQGAIVSGIAVCLFVLPSLAAQAWPWPITPLLAQLYAGPLLAYGLGSLLCAYQNSWEAIAATAPAMLVFTALTVIVSIIHSNLFSFSNLTSWIWFVAFGIATLALLALTSGLVRQSARYAAARVQA